YAGWTPKFLKKGSFLDLFGSIKAHNLFPMVKTGTQNMPLTWYLITQVLSSSNRKFADLLDFFPDGKESDWDKITAGQRVQVIRPNGDLQFGTEVITHSDGSIGGLLGASPGASTAAPIMLDLLKRCFPQRWESWSGKVAELAPGYGRTDWSDETSTLEALTRTAKALKIAEPHPLG
ncbi:MAG TPA: malate:quinone oxidoreductase, partial [Nocardioides sp.]|nr:malate:quinone oxidoreductase [Nocardioides sp.]